jgi:hypothetical protein
VGTNTTDYRNGFERIWMTLTIAGNAPAEKLRQVVQRCNDRSVVFDSITKRGAVVGRHHHGLTDVRGRPGSLPAGVCTRTGGSAVLRAPRCRSPSASTGCAPPWPG